MNKERIIYFAILSGIALYTAVLYFTHAIEGLFPVGGTEMYYCEYAAVILSLAAVYVALRMYKGSLVVRMSILELPLLADITFWQIFPDVPSFPYMAAIVFIGFLFVFPAKNNAQ